MHVPINNRQNYKFSDIILMVISCIIRRTWGLHFAGILIILAQPKAVLCGYMVASTSALIYDGGWINAVLLTERTGMK